MIAQIGAYAAFAVVIAYFSDSPVYNHHDPNMALIKLNFSHAAQRKGDCRRLTPEEIAALPPNMRRPMDCPRERLPVLVELVLDGELLFRGLLPPTGVAGDGKATAYERFSVAPGRYRLLARLRDSARDEGFDYENTTEIELQPRQSFVVDFKAETGGFIFL